MATRKARADTHHQSLKVLGRIAVDQARADADARWEALSASLPRDTYPEGLGGLADAVRRLIAVRPDLAHGTADPPRSRPEARRGMT
jgi:hypothetical protein